MGGILPPPQRPPNDREQALLAAIQAYADDRAPATDAEWLDVIEGLRNLSVDITALWERTVCEAKGAGLSHSTLARGMGIQRPTVISRVRDKPAQLLAEQPRQPIPLDPDPSAQATAYKRNARQARAAARETAKV